MAFFSNLKAKVTGADVKEMPTRNEVMVDEIRAFAQEVKAWHKQFVELASTIQKSLVLTTGMLDKPLPRVYVASAEGPSAPAVPVSSQLHIGAGTAPAGVQKASTDVDHALHQEILSKLEKWVADYRLVKEHHRECLKLYIKYKDQERAAHAMQMKYSKQKHGMHKDAESTLTKSKIEDEKTADLQRQYQTKEGEVHKELVAVIDRTPILRQCMEDAMAAILACFQAAHSVFLEGRQHPEVSSTQPQTPTYQAAPQAPTAYAQGAAYQPPAATVPGLTAGLQGMTVSSNPAGAYPAVKASDNPFATPTTEA